LHSQPTDKHVFECIWGGREAYQVEDLQDFVSVLIEQGRSRLSNSVGLMGDFGRTQIARDGQTVLDDAILSARVAGPGTDPRSSDCPFPSALQSASCLLRADDMLRRRLLETSSVDELAAEKACEHWGEQNG
jgi:hypothetical protein